MRLHHVGVRVRNAEAMRHFYVGILGLKPHPEKNKALVGFRGGDPAGAAGGYLV